MEDMVSETTAGDSAEDFSDLLKKQRGGRVVEEFSWLAKADPEYMKAYGRLAQMAFGYYENKQNYPSALPAKVKELIAVAILAGQRDGDRIYNHMERAMQKGATDPEILESLQVAAVCTGGPAMRLGVELLRKIRKQRGEHED